MTRTITILLALALTALATPAGAQPPAPVDVRVEGVFGNDVLIGDGYTSLAITLRNVTRETLRGRLRISAREHGQAEERHEVPLDLPGGESRRVVTTIFLGSSATVDARYEVDGAAIGIGSASATYSPGGRSLVILADPPRLRANLLDLQVSVPDRNAVPSYGVTATGVERALSVPIGVVALDPATADPILPDEALGWSSVGVAVASTAMIARVPDREWSAMVDWVRAGGHLVIAPRTPADLRAPRVRELIGAITTDTRGMLPSEFTPPGPGGEPIPALVCPDGATSERFGCATTIGFGIVYVLAFDVTAPPFVETPQARELSRSIAQRALRARGPRLALGRGRDQFSQEWWTGVATFSRLRAALDPNEGYRPALGLVAIVLFLYVLVVGPINFRFVLGRNAPTLALVTTPLVALACVMVMLFVGYLGKGVLTRYRRVEVLEVVEGESTATARGYTGLFLTRPSTVESDTPQRGLVMRLARGGGGDDGLVIAHGGDRPRLTHIGGALWETIFLRTDRVIELGGAPSFHYENNHLVAITNATRTTLRSAFVLDEGQVYAIGDVEPGATRPIPRTAAGFVSTTPSYDDASDPAPGQLTTHLGLDLASDAPYVRGVVRLLGQPSDPGEPLLWARVDPDEPPSASPGFALDHDLRVLIMHPRPTYELLGVAPVPVDPNGTWAPHEPVPTELPPTEVPPNPFDADAGTAGGAP